MNANNSISQRKHLRLKGHNYSSPGWYYLTICTQDRQCLLGKIINGKMKLNEFGKITKGKIKGLEKYQNINVDIYCVMPNHIHLIINIVGADPRVRPSSTGSCARPNQSGLTQGSIGSTQGSTPTVGKCVKRFKTLTTRIYVKNVKNNHWPPFKKRIWQRNFYEHIIRNEEELNRIRRYITDNVVNWREDENYK